MKDDLLKQRIDLVFGSKENLNPIDENRPKKSIEKIGLVNISKIFFQIFLISQKKEIKQIEVFSILFPDDSFDSTNSK